MELSVVSPCYGAPTLLRELVRQITETVVQLTDSYEIILVEDASPDNSRDIIREICAEDSHVKGVFLSRNFGQQGALNAGYDTSTGNYVVTLDCDLQNPPAQIRDLYLKIKEGYDIVFATRRNRPDSFFMTQWVGFKTAKVDVEHAVRTDGKKSSYSTRKRIELAVSTAVSFSTKSLRLIVYFGTMVTLAAIIGAIALVIKTVVLDTQVSGWATLFVSMWFIAGIMIMVMGIVAVYVGSIFDEVKRRPSYLIGETLNI